MMRMEMNVTLRCTRQCAWCVKLMHLKNVQRSDVTIEQARLFVEQLRVQQARMGRLKLMGGEPAIHPHLVELIDVFAEAKDVIGRISVQSSLNARSAPALRGKGGALKGKARWFAKTPTKKDHTPWLISPADLGVTGKYGIDKRCGVQEGCGFGFEKWGFTSCAIGGTLGRLLDVNPYSQRFFRRGIRDICKHCVFSLGPKLNLVVRKAAMRGEIVAPTPTFERALPRYMAEGGEVDFPVWSR